MRTARRIPVVFLIAILVLTAACPGVTPQRVALNSLQGIRDAVTTGLRVFNAGYQAGQYTDAQRDQLKVLYEKYLIADKVAAEALATTAATGDPVLLIQSVTIVAGDVLRFVQSLKKVP